MLLLLQEEEGEGGRELVALPGVQESAAGADWKERGKSPTKKDQPGRKDREGGIAGIQHETSKEARSWSGGCGGGGRGRGREEKKKKKKHNKKRKQNCARGESFRCPPFSLYNYRTTTHYNYYYYNCNYQLIAAQLLIHQFTMFTSLRLAPRLNNVLRPVVRWNSTASPASPPLMTKIRTDLKVAMRAKDTSRYAICIYIYSNWWLILTDLQIERPPGIDIGNQQLRQDRVSHPD